MVTKKEVQLVIAELIRQIGILQKGHENLARRVDTIETLWEDAIKSNAEIQGPPAFSGTIEDLEKLIEGK